MTRSWLRWPLRLLGFAAALLLALLALRIWSLEQGPPLRTWHLKVPGDLRAADYDRLDWPGLVAAEASLMAEVRAVVVRPAAPGEPVALSRYQEGSPVDPGRFTPDWNRSTLLGPAGEPAGAAVLVHGLTDAPYSMRHLAEHYRSRGYLVVVVRLPAHGTVPGALTTVEWPDYVAAVRLAVREARRRVPDPARPLHLVGFSTGGAAVLKYSLDALTDAKLPRAQQLVLLSPMIGLTELARFAGVAGWPALISRFSKAAWIDILPEYNPYKYNSFPVNAARQSYAFTRALQAQIVEHDVDGRIAGLPPVLAFQSVVDATVSASAVVGDLFDHLPANGSELVLFDVNRQAALKPMLRPATVEEIASLLPAPPRRYRATVVANAAPDREQVVERSTAAGTGDEAVRPLALEYPRKVFSLSHVALTYPVTDGLYGLEPDPAEDFGLHLGRLDGHGEAGVLLVSQDVLQRMQSNPFFPYVLERLDGLIAVPR